MTRIAALNDWSVGSSEEEDVGPTREALEAEATKSYNEAIRYFAHGNLEDAHVYFCKVLQNPYIEKACWPEGVEPGGTLPQDLALQYSCLKNLGNLTSRQGDYEQAAKYYLEAVQLDSSEVTLWQRLGATAIKLKDFELALVAFQEGLNINPKHWPCLDQLLSVLFILEMYMDCLGLIISALNRDPGYIKGNAFKDKIFELQPSLRQDVKSFFRDSSALFRVVDYDRVRGDKFIATCEGLRPSCKTMRPPSPFKLQQLRKPLPKLSWADLAHSLMLTYDALIEADGLEFAARIDVFDAMNPKEEKLSESDREDKKDLNENAFPNTETLKENVHEGDDVENGVGKEMEIMKESRENNSRSKAYERDEKEESKDDLYQYQNSEEKRSLSEAPQGSPLRISSRRRTIELGESQDSFRVSEKRRSVDSDTFSRPDDDLKETEERDGYVQGKVTFDDKNCSDQEMADKANISRECKQDVMEVTEAEENSECKLGEELEESTPAESSSKTIEKTNTENVDQETGKGKNSETTKCTGKADSGRKLQITLLDSENDFQGFTTNMLDEDGFIELVKEKPTDIGEEQVEEREKDGETAISDTGVLNEIIPEAVSKAENAELAKKLDREENKHDVETEEISEGELGELSSHGNDVCLNDMKSSTCDEKNREKENEERPDLLQKHARENMNTGITNTGARYGEEVSKAVKTVNVSRIPSGEEREKEVSLCEGFDQEDEDADEMEEDREDSRQDEEELEEEPEEGEEDGGSGENEMLQEDDEGLEGVISSEVTETEAAVNALKGIMALQPTEILGLPETDFDYDTEYVEYFDGGVYEEDDDMDQEEGIDQDDGMEQEEGTEQEEGIDNEGVEQEEGLDQEEDIDQEEGTEMEDGIDQEEGTEQGVDQEGVEQEGADHEQGPEQEEGIDQEDGIEQVEGTEQEEGIDQEDGTEREEGIDQEGTEQEDNTDQEEGMELEEGTDQEGTEQEEGVDHEEETEQEGMDQEGTEHDEEVDQGEGIEQEEGDTQQESSEQEGNVMEEDLEEQDELEKEGVEETEDGEDEDEEEQETGSQEEETTGNTHKQITKKREEESDDLLKEKRNDDDGDKAQQESSTNTKESAAKNKEENVKVDKDSEENIANSLNKVHLDTKGESKTLETSDKTNGSQPQTTVEAKRHKRHKRGLERELEQLDYWGRRQERDAKRRRRTISSKLLGTVEEAEYLTWGDLFRSFVPTSLLSCSVEDKASKQKTPYQSILQVDVGNEKSSSVPHNSIKSLEDHKKTNSVSHGDSSKEQHPSFSSPPAEGSAVSKAENITCGSLVSDDKVISDDTTTSTGKKSSVPNDAANLELGSHAENAVASIPEDQVPTCKKSEDSEVQSLTVNSTSNKASDASEPNKEIDFEQGLESETPSKCSERYEDTRAQIKKKRKEIILSSSATEEAQVEAFLLLHEENGGILDLLQQFLLILMKQHQKVWPITAARIFTEMYPRVRNHVFHGPALSLQENCTRLYQDSMLSLTNWELLVSLHQTSRLDALVKDRTGLHNPFSRSCPHLEDDLIHLTLMLGRGDVWVEETPQFHTRLRWVQAQIKLCQEEPEDAVCYLELLLSDLDRLADAEMEYTVDRVRIETDKTVVSNSEVKRHLNFLQRSQMLEQVVDNYTDGRYRVVAELLTTIFHEPLTKPRPGVTLPTRQTQLAILIDSLHKLGDGKEVMAWGAQSLAEALKRFNRAEAEEEKNRWAKTLMKISDTMNTTLEKNINIVDEVNRQRLVELVSTLIQMLVIQLERPQSAQILPFETLSPWILLHRLLAYEENPKELVNKRSDIHHDNEGKNVTDETVDRLQNEKTSTNTEVRKENSESLKYPVSKPDEATLASGMKNDVKSQHNSSNLVEESPTNELAKVHQNVTQNSDNTKCSEENRRNKMHQSEEQVIKDEVPVENKGPAVPYPSTLFLITAHDELGKHSWCCYDDGLFLLYCLDILLVELRRSLDDQHRQLLHHTLEQVSFCLYSHPSKKSKHKHLRDHGVPQIALCWERALQLYQYYCPSHLPDFQSSQIPSITDDVATLHKRIVALLPAEAKPENHLLDVEEYVNGVQAEFSSSPLTPPAHIIRDCFYLLGDYYFKNKEWNNAIKYYKLDITMNPERLDSWAPLGLAMKAMLETQLNSCEVIQDEEVFFSLAQAGVRCLRRALKLDEYHTNLWVEFGGLVYMVHSHASRLLKQDLNPDISLETFEMLEKLKGEMLTQAEHCFTKALKIQEEGWDDESLPDERWLHCYMLGKIAEKQGKPPDLILQYYCKAGQHLHQIQAKYPFRINYNSPQEYAVEALEMYYRAHAYILKYLQQREGKSIEQDVIKSFTKVLDELAVGPFASCQEKKKSLDANKTGMQDADSVINGTDTQVGELPKEDNAQKKRPLEDQENADEPPTKKVSNEKDSGDVIGVIEEVVDNIITDALSKSTRSGEDMNVDKESDARGSSVNTGQEGQEIAAKETNTIKATSATEKDKKDSDDEIQVVEEKVIEKKDHMNIIRKCITALKLCLFRFPQNYKAVYRLAHYYNTSKFHKDCSRARNYLLGCDFWQRVGYMPVNGLFNERKVWIQQPRNSNFFHGVWRIPNDDVDRPGSFAAHMYRCVSLTLDILPQMKDFYTVLQIALALKNSPEKDKKYLRDNERELLSEHATQVGLQAMKDKYKVLFKGASPVHNNRRLSFLLDVYRSYKQISKHLPGSEPHLAKMLTESYSSYRGFKPNSRTNILRDADAFCSRNQHLQYRIPVVTNSSQININSNVSGSPTVSRRGRPPGTGRGRGRGRGSIYPVRQSPGMVAIHEAYKIYENLIRAQTVLNNKDLDRSAVFTHQKELEYYQSELLKYLRIPSVSQYFQASLQGLGTASAKLPPPPKSLCISSPSTVSAGGIVSQPSTSSTTQVTPASRANQSTRPGQPRPVLSTLVSRSESRGISITSVTVPKSSTSVTAKPLKPNMSVTVSPAKTSCPPALQARGEISVVSVSRSAVSSRGTPATVSKPAAIRTDSVTTTVSRVGVSRTVNSLSHKPVASIAIAASTNTSKAGSSSASSTVPKLPAGTTLTRPREAAPHKGSAPRPQLQAEVRPAKNQVSDSNKEGLPGSVRKIIAETLSSTGASVTRPSTAVSSIKHTTSGQVTKPALPKDMSITPAPRIKSHSKLQMQVNRTSPPSSSSSSFLGAYQASLGLGGNKTMPVKPTGSSSPRGVNATVIRPDGRSPSSSQSNKSVRVTQLSTSQLLQLAYGTSGSQRGASGNISELLTQYSKPQQPLRVQSRPNNPTLHGPQTSLPQRSSATSSQRPQVPVSQQPQTNPSQRLQQPRPIQQTRPPQVRQSPSKPPQNKSGQQQGGSSDDIITLD